IVYRLYDVGYEIRLDQVLGLLAANAPERAGPTRSEAQAIQIRNPPITVTLASQEVPIGEAAATAVISARIFDFGGVCLRASIELPPVPTWSEFSELGNRLSQRGAWAPHFQGHVEALVSRIGSAIERPALSTVTEDYVVFRVRGLRDREGVAIRQGLG